MTISGRSNCSNNCSNDPADGRRLLEAAISEAAFATNYIKNIVNNISRQFATSAKIAKVHPQAAYAAFTRGMIGKWSFLTRTMGNSAPQLQLIEDTIRQ